MWDTICSREPRPPSAGSEPRVMGFATTQPEPSVSDAEIIARIYSGDEGAMALLYDRYSHVV